jgi:hypothetical protein
VWARTEKVAALGLTPRGMSADELAKHREHQASRAKIEDLGPDQGRKGGAELSLRA